MAAQPPRFQEALGAKIESRCRCGYYCCCYYNNNNNNNDNYYYYYYYYYYYCEILLSKTVNFKGVQ